MNIEDSSLRPLYLAIFSFTVLAFIVITAVFGECQDCANWLEVVEAGTGRGVLHGTAIISIMEVIQAMILLPSEYVRYKFVEPLKQRIFNEGKAEMRAEIMDWMREKEEADREGIPFDKPMPGAEHNGSAPKR